MVNGKVIDPIEQTAGDHTTTNRPYPPKDDAHIRNDTKVHMLLSAFRDPRCGQTVANSFLRARHPERIYVGIVQQNLPDKDKFDCISIYCALMQREGYTSCPYLDHLEIVRVDAKESKGPIWARAIGAVMVQPHHEFCMQVDAHVDFMEHYDVALMKMWAMTENEYGVLSTYVGNVKQDLSKTGHVLIGHPYYEIPFICKTIVGGHGVVRNDQATGAYCLPRPHLSFTWAAGWSFAKCHFERNVPNDPFLEGMFDGEEFSRMIRLWTHGYDVYTPHRPVVFHDYTHGRVWQQGRESTWNGNPPGLPYALKRYWSLVDKQGAEKVELGPYGLGTQRSIDQYIDFAGIDPRTSKFLDNDKCGKLKYIPFEEDPNKIHAIMPTYPTKLPGNQSQAHLEPPPDIEDKYVSYAHEMITIEKDQEPTISHERQKQEFGSPPKALWSDLTRKVSEERTKRRQRRKQTQHENSSKNNNNNNEKSTTTGTKGGGDTVSWTETMLAVILTCGVFYVGKELYSTFMETKKDD